jgi:hypothetical protein
MNSLRELNNYASQPMTFTDNRPANVIFDRAEAEDLAFTELVRVFTVKNTINIEEIIQPQICDVRYQINVGDLAGILSWPSLPPEVSVEFTNFGTIYIVSGITTAALWDLVKNPTISLPEDYNGTFSYTAKIIYNTNTQSDLEMSWQVGVYAPLSLMAAKVTATATGRRVRRPVVNILSSFGIGFGTIIKGRLEASGLNASAAFTGVFNGSDFDFATANLNVTGVLTSTFRRFRRFSSIPALTGRFTETVNGNVYKAISNMSTNRSILHRQGNNIFATTTPYIEEPPGLNATYTIEFIASTGDFRTGTFTWNSTYTFTGTMAQCNAKFAEVQFWPRKHTYAGATITYNQYKNSALQITKSFLCPISGNGTFNIGFYGSVVGGASSFNITEQEYKYGIMDYVIVGAGGGGSANGISGAGGGGGGGQVIYQDNQIISQTSYSFIIGNGGSTGTVEQAVANFSNRFRAGTSGGSSSFLSQTAQGGGGSNSTASSGAVLANIIGGTSGNGNAGVKIATGGAAWGGGTLGPAVAGSTSNGGGRGPGLVSAGWAQNTTYEFGRGGDSWWYDNSTQLHYLTYGLNQTQQPGEGGEGCIYTNNQLQNGRNGAAGAVLVRIRPDILNDDNSSGRTRRTVIYPSNFTTTSSNAFIGNSGEFGGKKIVIPSATETAWGTGDFTLECWIRCNQLGLNSTIFTFGNISMLLGNMRPGIFLSGGSVIQGTQTIPNFTWRHVAWVREGGSLRVYSSGQLALTQSLPDNYSAQDIIIGANSDLSNAYEGLMDEVRFSNIARYTANFSSTVGSGGYVDDANTVLLLHFNS